MSKAFEKHFVTSNKMRTICEVLREIYWHTEDPVIREKVTEAEVMAKKMSAKLHENAGLVWEPNEDHEKDAAQRREKYENENRRADVRKGRS